MFDVQSASARVKMGSQARLVLQSSSADLHDWLSGCVQSLYPSHPDQARPFWQSSPPQLLSLPPQRQPSRPSSPPRCRPNRPLPQLPPRRLLLPSLLQARTESRSVIWLASDIPSWECLNNATQ